MPVVTAGMHPARVLRAEGKAGLLLNRQSIHVAAKSGGIRFPHIKIGQYSAAPRRNDPAAQPLQLGKQVCLGFWQLVIQLRDAVQRR